MTNLDSIFKKQRHYFVDKGPSSQGYGFSSSHVRTWELDYKESWAPKTWCFWTVVLEKTLESPFGLQRDQISQSQRKSTLNIHWKDWCYFGHLMWRTDSLQKPWCWERLKAGEVNDRGWDGWMASPTWWTWVWVNSRSWWRTRKPRLLPSMRLQSARHDWAIELIHERKF